MAECENGSSLITEDCQFQVGGAGFCIHVHPEDQAEQIRALSDFTVGRMGSHGVRVFLCDDIEP